MIKARKLCKLTQDELAENMGTVSRRAISSYESGQSNPSLEVAIQIAQHLQVSLDWLCGLSDLPHEHYAQLYNLSPENKKALEECAKVIAQQLAKQDQKKPELV